MSIIGTLIEFRTSDALTDALAPAAQDCPGQDLEREGRHALQPVIAPRPIKNTAAGARDPLDEGEDLSAAADMLDDRHMTMISPD